MKKAIYSFFENKTKQNTPTFSPTPFASRMKTRCLTAAVQAL